MSWSLMLADPALILRAAGLPRYTVRLSLDKAVHLPELLGREIVLDLWSMRRKLFQVLAASGQVNALLSVRLKQLHATFT